MREIKFRVYNKTANKMIEWYSLREMDELAPWIEEGENKYYSSAMQYTGLSDQNKKEIYEGDVILKVSTDSKYAVYYSDKSACYRVKRQDGWHFHLFEIIPSDEWEVIGNIYEMPEWDS